MLLPPLLKTSILVRQTIRDAEAPLTRILEAKENAVQLQTKLDSTNLVKDSANYRAERELNIHHFRELLHIFKSKVESGNGTMDRAQFLSSFSAVMGTSDEQMDSLFMKIDTDLNNIINWDDFSTFMLLRAEGQKKMREEAETQLFQLDPSSLHRLPLPTPHKDHIGVILHIPACKRYVTVGRDGIVCYWSETFKLLRRFKQEDSGESTRKQPNNWVHDCRFLSSCGKLICASDDHCISFHDFGTAKCDVRLNIGDQIPLSVDIWYDQEKQRLNETMLIYGTDAGMVGVFTFTNDALFQFNKNSNPMVNLDAFFRIHKGPTCSLVKKKLHSDWVMKVRYYPSLRSIISCSPDPKESLVVSTHQLGSKKWSYTAIPIHKGVNTFAYCKFPAVLVTAGTDRQLRMWNVHRLHNPMAALRGHSAPVIDLAINEMSGQIISLSTDKCVKVWDIRSQTCVQTLTDPFTHRPEDYLCSIHFNSGLKTGTLVCASTTLTPYQLQASKKNIAGQGPTKSHDFPLRAAIFNPEFNQIVSGCDGGIINVWDGRTGAKTFRLNANSNGEEITAMNFDANYRRLITGGRAGTLVMWNFNNGQILHELGGIEHSSEITGVLYIEMKECFYIVATGWCRRIILFKYEEGSYNLSPDKILPPADSNPWHSDDILALAFVAPNILATGSVDGEICVANLITGHLLHRLKQYEDCSQLSSVDKLIYLTNREDNDAANLISVGSDGRIKFWNSVKGYLMWEFGGESDDAISAVCLDSTGNTLYTGDSKGMVSVWNIESTCLSEKVFPLMPLITSFRAHIKAIQSVDIMERASMIITASIDCTSRVFTAKGDYVGTLGQSDAWDISCPDTFQHPSKPLDVVMSELETCDDETAYQKLREMAQRLLTKKSTKSINEKYILETDTYDGEMNGESDEEDEINASLDISKAGSRSALKLPVVDDKRRGGAVRVRKPQGRLASALDLINAGARLRTADLVKKYGTWYARTNYVEENKHRPPFMAASGRKSGKLVIKNGIYHSLKPMELNDIHQIIN